MIGDRPLANLYAYESPALNIICSDKYIWQTCIKYRQIGSQIEEHCEKICTNPGHDINTLYITHIRFKKRKAALLCVVS